MWKLPVVRLHTRQSWRKVMKVSEISVNAHYRINEWVSIIDTDCILTPGADGDCFKLFIWLYLLKLLRPWIPLSFHFTKQQGETNSLLDADFTRLFPFAQKKSRGSPMSIWERASDWSIHVISCPASLLPLCILPGKILYDQITTAPPWIFPFISHWLYLSQHIETAMHVFVRDLCAVCRTRPTHLSSSEQSCEHICWMKGKRDLKTQVVQSYAENFQKSPQLNLWSVKAVHCPTLGANKTNRRVRELSIRHNLCTPIQAWNPPWDSQGEP